MMNLIGNECARCCSPSSSCTRLYYSVKYMTDFFKYVDMNFAYLVNNFTFFVFTLGLLPVCVTDQLFSLMILHYIDVVPLIYFS